MVIKMILLWSSMYEDNVCENCENCCDDCNYYKSNGELDYDYLNDAIMEDLSEKFYNHGVNSVNHEYFVCGFSYTNYYGMKQNMNGFTDVYESVEDIIFNCLHQGGIYEGFRIYKGKYNHIIIERVHHDGVEYYQLCRLNSQGQDFYDKGYDFDFRKHCVKGVFKDFEFYNQNI